MSRAWGNWVARVGLVGLCGIGLGGCGGGERSITGSADVTVQLDVTSSGSAVTSTGSIQQSVNVRGTTPFSGQFRVPIDITCSGPSVQCSPGFITAIINASVDANTAFTVCLQDLGNGQRDCQTGKGPIFVAVSTS
jgi:hypothetical protein